MPHKCLDTGLAVEGAAAEIIEEPVPNRGRAAREVKVNEPSGGGVFKMRVGSGDSGIQSRRFKPAALGAVGETGSFQPVAQRLCHVAAYAQSVGGLEIALEAALLRQTSHAFGQPALAQWEGFVASEFESRLLTVHAAAFRVTSSITIRAARSISSGVF